MERTISERFCDNRQKVLAKLMTPQNTAAARLEIESIILPELERQGRWNPTSTLYSVTYYSVASGAGENNWKTQNIDYKRSNGESRPVKRDVLSVAVELARTEYKISAEEAYEEGYWVFQFTIKL